MKSRNLLFIVIAVLFVGTGTSYGVTDSLVSELSKRYRDTETGTFLTPDPLGFVDGPNRYAYVVQNPWTKFDPHGLKFDDATFDEKEDRMKTWDQLDDKTQDKFKGQDWFTDSTNYNERVGNFNKELEKLRETPFGSAQYDYLKSHEKTFTLQFGTGSDGPGSKRSFVNFGSSTRNASYTIAGMDSFGTITHEFQHLVQSATPAAGHMSRPSYQRRQAGPFKFLADPSDGNDMISVEGGRVRPAYQEFHAQRAKNIAENEYALITSVDGLVMGREQIVQTGPTSWEMQRPRVQPTLKLLQGTGVADYNDGGGAPPYGFQNPSGSYSYEDVLNR